MGLIAVIFIIVICIIILNEMAKEEARKEMEEQKIQNLDINLPKTDRNKMTDEEYREKSLQQLQSTNINLVQLQSQIAKQNEKIREIEKNVGCITTILAIPIAIAIIGLIIKAVAGYSYIQLINNIFGTM